MKFLGLITILVFSNPAYSQGLKTELACAQSLKDDGFTDLVGIFASPKGDTPQRFYFKTQGADSKFIFFDQDRVYTCALPEPSREEKNWRHYHLKFEPIGEKPILLIYGEGKSNPQAYATSPAYKDFNRLLTEYSALKCGRALTPESRTVVDARLKSTVEKIISQKPLLQEKLARTCAPFVALQKGASDQKSQGVSPARSIKK